MVTVELKLPWPHQIENGPPEVAMGMILYKTKCNKMRKQSKNERFKD